MVGALTLEPLLLKEKGPFPYEPWWAAPHNDELLWADGERSVLEIFRCARLEAGRGAEGDEGQLKELVAYFEFLEEKGYVDMG